MDESAPLLETEGKRRRRRGGEDGPAGAAYCVSRDCCAGFLSKSARAGVHGWDDINLEDAEAARLNRLKAAVAERYDHGAAEKELLWERLWTALSRAGQEEFPGFISPQWRDVGFQQDNPRSDLRSSRKLGLTQLVTFAEANSAFCRSYLAACPSLPLCAVGLNMTYNLTQHLLLRSSDEALMPLYGGTQRIAGCCGESRNFDNVTAVSDPDLEFKIAPGGDRADLIGFAEELSAYGDGMESLQVLYDMALKAVLEKWKLLGGGDLLLLSMQPRVYPAGWKAVEAHLLSAQAHLSQSEKVF